jgi:hypothetical protein
MESNGFHIQEDGVSGNKVGLVWANIKINIMIKETKN